MERAFQRPVLQTSSNDLNLKFLHTPVPTLEGEPPQFGDHVGSRGQLLQLDVRYGPASDAAPLSSLTSAAPPRRLPTRSKPLAIHRPPEYYSPPKRKPSAPGGSGSSSMALNARNGWGTSCSTTAATITTSSTSASHRKGRTRDDAEWAYLPATRDPVTPTFLFNSPRKPGTPREHGEDEEEEDNGGGGAGAAGGRGGAAGDGESGEYYDDDDDERLIEESPVVRRLHAACAEAADDGYTNNQTSSSNAAVDEQMVERASYMAASVSPTSQRTLSFASLAPESDESGTQVAAERAFNLALLEASRARADCDTADKDSFAELSRCSWPNQQSSLAARALLNKLSRAAARLRGACERLEKESFELHSTAGLEAAYKARRDRSMISWLTNQRDTSEAALASELASAEAEVERQEVLLRDKAREELRAREATWYAQKTQLRDEKIALSNEAKQKTLEHGDMFGKVTALQATLDEVRRESMWARREREAELERVKAEAKRLAAGEKAEADARIRALEATIVRMGREKSEVLRRYEEKKGELDEAEDDVTRQLREAQLRLQDVEAEKVIECMRLQHEIDRLRMVHRKALETDALKGRQILFLDSLRAPSARANDPLSERRALLRSQLTWRDAAQLDEAMAARMYGGGGGGGTDYEQHAPIIITPVGGAEGQDEDVRAAPATHGTSPAVGGRQAIRLSREVAVEKRVRKKKYS